MMEPKNEYPLGDSWTFWHLVKSIQKD